MACCTGVTECDQLITIGFLKTFIGSDIKSSVNGSTLSVNTSESDSYCPTYAELTGGTLVQNWKQGTTANGDRDGIIIGDTYANNQCVKRTHLSMKYTRFSTFTISVSPATISACSGTSTLSFTHEYIRYTKSLNGKCESAATPTSSGVSDTASGEVTYTSSNNVFSISGNKVTVGKNNPNGNGRSTARSTTITGKVTFRGTNHQSQKTITQSGLGGEYKYYVSESSITNKDISCHGGPSFGCEGGNYSAEATHTLNTWDIYVYEDSCGTRYPNDTDIRNSSSTTVTAYTYSGSFSDKTGQCGRWEDSKSWDGYGNCSWTQSCTTCPCSSYTEWNEGTYTGTVDCSGGTVAMNNITIPGTYHYKYVDPETSECVEELTPTSKTESASVNFSCNTDTASKTHTGVKNGIRYTITQPAGPCCQPNSTTSYTTVYLSCDAHNNEEISTSYTVRTTGSCCETSSGSYRTGVYYATIGCNSGTTRTLNNTQKGGAPFTVYQRGNCNCCTCDNADLNVASTAAGSSVPGSGYTASTIVGTYNSSTCLTALTVSSNVNWITNLSLSNGNIYGKVSSNPSMTDGRNAIITVSGKDGKNNSCSGTCSINQFKLDCTCDNANLNVAATSAGSSIPANGYTTVTTIGTYNNNTCLTGLTVSSSENWVTNVSLSNGNVNAKVSENTSLTNNRNSTITVKGINGSGGECASAFTVTQVKSATTCICENINLNATASSAGLSIPAAGYSSSTTIGTYNNSTCLTNITATSSQNWATVSVSNGNVNATVQANTSLTNDRNSTITVQGIDALGNTCYDTFNIKQVMSAITCTCSGLTINKTSETWDYNVTTSKDITITSASCISNIATSGTLTHFTATISSGKVTVHPNGNNTTSSAYTETFNITYKASGNDCSSAITLTQKVSECLCENVNLNVSVTAAGVSIPSTGYSASTVIGTYNNSTCLTSITATSNQNWVTNINVSNGNVSAKVSENTSTSSARTSTITVKGYDGNNNECSGFFTVTQSKKVITCLCSDLVVTAGSNIPCSGGNVTLGTYTDGNGCVTGITATSSKSFISNLTCSNGVIRGNATQNPITATTSSTITVIGYADGVQCTKTFNVTQNGCEQHCPTGDTWVINATEMECDPDDKFEIYATRTRVTYENGVCNTTVTNFNQRHVWLGQDYPINTGDTEITYNFDVYVGYDCASSKPEGSEFAINTSILQSLSCGTIERIGSVTVKQPPCSKECPCKGESDPALCDCVLGTDNNQCNVPFRLEWDNGNGWTSDSYRTNLGVYGRNFNGNVKNVTSSVDTANSTPGATNYIQFCDGPAWYAYKGNDKNEYGGYVKLPNSGTTNIILRINHSANIAGVCSSWYSEIKYFPTKLTTYTVYGDDNSNGATVMLYSDGNLIGSGTTTNGSYVFETYNNYTTVTAYVSKNDCTITPSSAVIGGDSYIYVTADCAGPQPSQYTYTVYGDSDSNGATVTFYYGGTPIDSGSITNGSYTFVTTTKYGRIDVSISKSDCIITPSSTTLDADSSVSVTASCSGPQPTYYTYTVNGNSDANGATVILSYNLSPVAEDVITNGYYTFTTTTYYDSLDAYISKNGCTITPDSTSILVDNSVTVTADCSGPQPSDYTYTVNDSNGNAEGADVAWWYNGTQFDATTIVNGVSQITREDGVTVNAIVTKDGCTASYSPENSISADGSITVTMNCGSPGTCTWCGDINISLSTTYNPPSYASGGEQIAMFDATPVCEGSFIATHYRGDAYLYDMTVSNIGGDSYMVYASWPENQGAERTESIAITFVTSEGNYISCEYPEITQPAGPCATATSLTLSSTSLFTPSSEGGNADIVLNGDVNCYSLTDSDASVSKIHLGAASIMGGSIVIPVQFDANDSGDTGRITLKFGNINAGDEKTFYIDVEWAQ